MKLSLEGRYRHAIHCAFVLGAVGASIGPSASYAASGDTTQLQGVQVTGSRIRRVDTETADTVQTLDRKQILATGASTLGELLQSIPSFGGTPFNSAVNNGGGTGEAFVDLRGLAPKRTLILLDGQRLNNADVNAIPTNMIERVEVLKEGAAAVYGTDAIGGVVNFITRKTFTGVEAELSAGQTQYGDGSNGDVQLTWGTKAGAGNAVFGALFNRQDAIKASARSFSNTPWGYYYGHLSPNAWTSSRSPNGRFNISADTQLKSALGCSNVTLIQGTNGTTAQDYRCYVSNNDVGPSDRYNYQPENLSLIPSKRISLFGLAQEPITDSIKWFGQGTYTDTRANAQLAAEPFDDGTIQGTYPGSKPTISAQNIYNPFGVNITSFRKRSTQVGDRVESFETNSLQLATGLKGTLVDRFQWDTTFNFGRYNQANSNYGFLDFSKIFQQLGPSFYADANGNPTTATAGTPTCGTPGHIIPNCTPINVFGTTGNTLAALGTQTNYLQTNDEMDLAGNISGDLFKLPAGMLGAATGVEYRTLHYSSTPDALGQQFQLSENNSQSTNGMYNVREAYLEVHVPVLKGLPAVKSLDFDLGGRYSNYSSFGNNTSGKVAMEYRPYSDLLVRATYNDVYRAPTTTELFQGALQGSPAYSDPCSGLDAATLAQHPISCANVPVNYRAPVPQANGNTIGNPHLTGEKGYATDFGLVFDPSFYKPLSISVDYWIYQLKQAIDTVDINTVLQGCYDAETAGSASGSAFCGNAPNGLPYITRSATTGDVVNTYEPFLNANRYKVNGIDTSIKLNYPNVNLGGVNVGRIQLGVDATYLMTYDLKLFDPFSGALVNDYSDAGYYDSSTGGSYPRLRALGYLFWSKGPYSIALQDRFLSNLKENQVDAADPGPAAGGCYSPGSGDVISAGQFGGDPTKPVRCYHNTGSANYVDLSGTYSFKPINTDVTLGITDLFSESAQQMYNGSLAGAANPIYDVRGRSFYGKVVLRFK